MTYARFDACSRVPRFAVGLAAMAAASASSATTGAIPDGSRSTKRSSVTMTRAPASSSMNANRSVGWSGSNGA